MCVSVCFFHKYSIFYVYSFFFFSHLALKNKTALPHSKNIKIRTNIRDLRYLWQLNTSFTFFWQKLIFSTERWKVEWYVSLLCNGISKLRLVQDPIHRDGCLKKQFPEHKITFHHIRIYFIHYRSQGTSGTLQFESRKEKKSAIIATRNKKISGTTPSLTQASTPQNRKSGQWEKGMLHSFLRTSIPKSALALQSIEHPFSNARALGMCFP